MTLEKNHRIQNILVVDNDRVFQSLMVKFLEKNGYTVKGTNNGLQALDVLQTYRPDVIFIDLVMPHIDGAQLCRTLRAMAPFKDTYLVILSAISAEQPIDISRLGADACIAKCPFGEMSRHVLSAIETPEAFALSCRKGKVFGSDNVFPRGITEELLLIKRHFQIILDKMTEGVFETNAEGRIVYANPSAISLAGMRLHSLLGVSFANLFSGDDRQRLSSLLQTGAAASIDYESAVCLNRFQVTATLFPLDQTHTTLIILRDVTDQKNAQKALETHRDDLEKAIGERTADLTESKQCLLRANALIQSKYEEARRLASHLEQANQQLAESKKALEESEVKYRKIVKHAPAGISEFDTASNRFIDVNDIMCDFTGCSEDELLQMGPFELLSEESRSAAEKIVEQALFSRKDPPPVELEIVGKSDRALQVVANFKFFFKYGQPQKGLMVVHDLTEIRKAETEKRALEAKLQNAKKLESIGRLAGGVAHDLNNILSGIVSYPDLLLMDLEPDSPLRQPLLTVKNSGQKAAEIVQDLLTLARRNVASKKVLSLNRIVTDFIATPEYRAIVDGRKQIRLETRLCDGILNVTGSEIHLSKTVMNLVANAADAMPTGGVITIATRDCYLDQAYAGFETVPAGEYGVVDVTDQGIGMPTADLEKIFEPFYTKKVLGRSGTGLGMSVVWGTVKDHNGFVDIMTEEGTGTRFVLYFPGTRAEIQACESVHIEDYTGQGESLLVVDDAPEQRELTRRMMQRLGYDVHTAASGETAVAMIKNRAYDILILDMIMPPGIDGLETYRRILEIAPGQKAVIASGYAKTHKVLAAQRMGAGSYIRKPFTMEKIGLAVRAELEDRSCPSECTA